MGYHYNKIPKGIYGEFSKVKEEIAELEDAVEQGNKIMILLELADLYGAIEGYLEKNFPGFNMEEIEDMSEKTKSAFEDGSRK